MSGNDLANMFDFSKLKMQFKPIIPPGRKDQVLKQESSPPPAPGIDYDAWFELLSKPTFIEDKEQRLAAASIAVFFTREPDLADKDGISRSTLEDLIRGTGKFTESALSPEQRDKVEQQRTAAQKILDTPGLFDQLDQLGPDGKRHPELANNHIDPENVKNLIYPPVYM